MRRSPRSRSDSHPQVLTITRALIDDSTANSSVRAACAVTACIGCIGQR